MKSSDIVIINTHIIGDDDQPISFSFSKGMHAFNLPELFVYGLIPDIGTFVVNVLAERLAAGTLQFDVALKVSGIDSPMLVKRVTPEQSTYRFGKDHAPSPAREMLQVVWGDNKQRFPWDEGHHPDNLRFQPFLFNR